MSECKKLEKCGHCACYADLDYDFPGCQWCAMMEDNEQLSAANLQVVEQKKKYSDLLQSHYSLCVKIEELNEAVQHAKHCEAAGSEVEFRCPDCEKFNSMGKRKCPSTYTHSTLGKLACAKDEGHLNRHGDVEHQAGIVKWMSI